MKNNIKIEKIIKWEYWPSFMFYVPNIPFVCYHIIKAKNLVFFTATNPGIENSGIGTESKFKTLSLFPKEYLPKTILHKADDIINNTLITIDKKAITYPLIAKPDIGFRGLLVRKINTKNELIIYLKKYPIDIIIQEFLIEKNECGIFYHRLPTNKEGKITSITLKEFLSVTGNGISTLKELILNDRRANVYLDIIKDDKNLQLQKIIENGKKINLSCIGNHSKGTRFINGNHLISEKLEKTFDNLNNNSWYYGRLDIKYNSFDDVINGDFKILELNGILAEPTHIYDTKNTTYFKALKDIRIHWKQLSKIANLNLQKNNNNSTLNFIKDIKKLKKYTTLVSKLNNN